MTLKRRLLSVMLAFVMLITYMPITNNLVPVVHAEEVGTPATELDLVNGNIVITSTGYTIGDAVTEGSISNYVIKNSSNSGESKNNIIIDGFTGTVELDGIRITSSSKAPVLIQNGSNVIVNITNVCVLTNTGTSDSNKPEAWPGICIGDGQNTVRIAGDGDLYTTGGQYCPGIGGTCSDDKKVAGYRTSSFESQVTLAAKTVIAQGGSNAPNIGTGRGCNVTGGKFIFESGEIEANTTNGNSVGIGVCESISNANFAEPNFQSNLTLSFTGATVLAAGGTNCAAIGAGNGQRAYKINISGGNIKATAGKGAPAIGNGASGTGTPDIVISGGDVTATYKDNSHAVKNASPIQGHVDVSNYEDMSLMLNSTITAKGSVRIPYAEYIEENYISSRFSAETGTYYKTVVTSPSYAEKGKTCKYLSISKCDIATHKDVSTPSEDDPVHKHNGRCIYCDHISDGVPHNWTYTKDGNNMTETCESCGETHTITIADSAYIYDGSTKTVSLSGIHATVPNIVYTPVPGSEPLPGEPTDVGKYAVVVSFGSVSVDTYLEITKSPMDIHVISPEYTYDGNGHTVTLEVVNPANAKISYSTDGKTYSKDIPSFVNVGKHPIFYKITANNYKDVYSVAYVHINPRAITGVTLDGVNAPVGGVDLDANANCSTPGVAMQEPVIYWLDERDVAATGTAKFNAKYKCYINIEPDRTKYAFSTSSPCAVTVNGSPATEVVYNPDGSLKVYYEFSTTAKAQVSYVKPLSDITLEYGAEKSVEGLHLPDEVSVTCDDVSIRTLPIEWAISSASYDTSRKTEQIFTVGGSIKPLPDHVVFKSGIEDSVVVKVKVLADRTDTITADLDSTEYDEEKVLHLRTGVTDDIIYYTINGDDPFIDDTTPAAGAKICTDAGISLTCDEGSSSSYHILARAKRENLRPSELFDKTYVITVSDKTAPTLDITIAQKSWQEFLSDVTFGLFTTETYTVSVTAQDNCELKEVFYYLSDHVLSYDEIQGNVAWTPYTKEFTISDKNKYVVYAKAADATGNVAYANSDGLVIYENSEAVTTEVSVTPNVTKSVDFTVKLNGNEVDEIYLGATAISQDSYKFDSTTGTVTLYNSAFDTLSYGEYNLTITYKPQGEKYLADAGNTAPGNTTLLLKVLKPRVLGISTPAAVTNVPNGTSLSDIKLPTKVGITTDPVTVTEVDVEWDTNTIYSGSYDPSILVEQNFVIHGTVLLSQDDVDLNGLSTDIYIDICVNPANQLAAPTPELKGGSYANRVTVKLLSSDNAEIYYTLDKSTPTTASTRYTEPFEITETTTVNAICHTEGRFDSDVMSVTYNIVFVDESAPTGSIQVGTESFWSSLWSGILYQFFTKKIQTVTITGEDAESGIQAIFYYISPAELTKDDLEEVTGWELYTEPLHLDPNVGGIIYAKIINGDGLECYVNSNGIVVYTDPEKVTESVTYVKGTGNDVEFTVKLNGNSIKAMRNGNTALSPTHYSQTFSGNIVISAAYLETLSTGNYTFYLDYYPLGINNSNAAGHSEAPASTSVNVLISAKSTGANTGTGSNTGGGSSSGTPNVPIVIPQNPNAEGNATGTTTKTDSSGVVHTIDTVTYTDKSKTITDTSTDKNKTKTVTVTEKDAKGATTTVATKITTHDGTETYTVTEYVSANETKTTTNKSDTKGNSYERVYVTNKDGSFSENIVSTVSDVKTTDTYKVDVSGNLSQTYQTTKELNGEIIDITVRGSGTQTNPTYTETYTLVEDGLDACTVTVKRTNSSANASASVVKTNEAGNKVTISSELLDDMLTTASWNDVNGSLPSVSKVHEFSSKRKAVSDIDVTYKVLNDAGDKRYTLLFNTDDIVAGNKIRQFRYTGGKYVMLGSNYKTVSDSGNVSVAPSKNYTYLLAGPSTYKSINNAIKDSAVFASTATADMSKGKSTYFKLDEDFDSRNIKSITYKSKNGLVASVTDNGKVTAKHKGTAKITATIKFVNGGSKTISRNVKVK